VYTNKFDTTIPYSSLRAFVPLCRCANFFGNKAASEIPCDSIAKLGEQLFRRFWYPCICLYLRLPVVKMGILPPLVRLSCGAGGVILAAKEHQGN
jgi:hypothetical protein